MENELSIIDNQIKKLPQSLRVFALDGLWPQELSLTAVNNDLTEDQENALKAEVFLTIIGLTNYSDFKTNVQKNLPGVSTETVAAVVVEIDKEIFSEIKSDLLKLNAEIANEKVTEKKEETLSKESVLNEIENPTPARPSFSKPNIVLDAQHNLPAQENKVLLSSAAVMSRGPMIGNVKNGFGAQPNPIKPIAPAPEKYTVDPYRESTE